MADTVKHILISATDLANQFIEASNEVIMFKNECDKMKIKVQKLLELLEKALVTSSNLCEFPTRHVISIAETALQKSLSLLEKCIPKLSNRVFSIIHVATYQKTLVRLETSINDVLWLLNVSTPSNDGEEKLIGLPPSAMHYPTQFLIYKLMAILYTGPLDDSCEAARSLRSMACDSPKHAEFMVRNGLCSIFVKILRQGSMKAQAEVACATSVLVASFPESQNLFAKHDVVQLLLSHLISGTTPELKVSLLMKAMAAKALRELAKGNSTICKSITDSKRFLRFPDLLETKDREVRYNSLMILVEITSVAEQDSELRHSAFNSKSPVFKAIVNQFHKLIQENGEKILLIRLIGSLARAFRASETQMIEQLVKLLGHQDPEVSREAIVALTKFTSPCNYLHKDHTRAIVEAGGAKKLIELSYLGCEIRILALELLICIL